MTNPEIRKLQARIERLRKARQERAKPLEDEPTRQAFSELTELELDLVKAAVAKSARICQV